MSEYVFEPASYWTRVDFDEANHEAGHVAIAHYFGLPLREARIDRPDTGIYGRVLFHPDAPLALEQRLMAIMAGNLAEMRPNPIEWPPYPEAPGDEADCAKIVAHLGLDRLDFEKYTTVTRELLQLESVVRVRKAVGRALLDRGALSETDLQEIFDEVSPSSSDAPPGVLVLRVEHPPNDERKGRDND